MQRSRVLASGAKVGEERVCVYRENIMIGTPIAFGLTMVVCFTLFYYYWRIRQLRARLLSVQATAPAHDVDFPVGFGIGKNVVETFPTIEACELKSTASEDLQCPICLVEYEQWEVLRQLPFCGHIFHTLCVGAWFEKQTTCPVCRTSMSELTHSFATVDDDHIVYRGPRPSVDSAAALALVEPTAVIHESPSWIRINHRHLPVLLPAPPTLPPSESTTTRACTCSGAATTTTALAKPELGNNALPRSTTDIHHIQQCKCSTAKTVVTSEQHSDVQILIFQTSVQLASDPIRLDVERFLSAGVTSNNNKPLETPHLVKSQEKPEQPFVSPAGSTSSRCACDTSPNSGGDALR